MTSPSYIRSHHLPPLLPSASLCAPPLLNSCLHYVTYVMEYSVRNTCVPRPGEVDNLAYYVLNLPSSPRSYVRDIPLTWRFRFLIGQSQYTLKASLDDEAARCLQGVLEPGCPKPLLSLWMTGWPRPKHLFTRPLIA